MGRITRATWTATIKTSYTRTTTTTTTTTTTSRTARLKSKVFSLEMYKL